MEDRTKYALMVAGIALLVFCARLLITLQVAEPSYSSYPALIQAEAIREQGHVRYSDPYSFEGRTYAKSPLYYYLVALFTLFLPALFVVKALPALCMAGLVPLLYLLSHKLTKSRGVSLLVAFFCGFSPVLFLGAADATPLSLAIPLMAALLLALMNLEERPILVFVLAALLTFLTPLIWLVLVALLCYLAILAAERMPISTKHLETSLFIFLLAAWFTLITYKEALQRYGFGVLHQSLPSSVQTAMYSQFTLLGMVYAVGVIPLALGSLALYYAAFEARSRKVFLVASFGLTILVAASLRILALPVALLLLGLVFVILSAPGLAALAAYLRKTRFERLQAALLGLLIIAFFFTSVFPALVAGLYPGSAPTPSESDAATWLRAHTPNSSVILATPRSGAFLNYVARRKYVADEEYLLITNPNEILADIDRIYTTPSKVGAVETLQKYNVDYIFIGSREHSAYRQFGAIIIDRTCFPIAYENRQVQVLAVNCTVEVSR